MGFRRAATLHRKSGGDYVDGRWTEGATTSSTITVSVQNPDEDRKPLPENERAENVVTIYTSTKLIPGGRPGIEADRVEVDGVTYEVKTVEAWQNGILNHYKATAAEVIA